MYTEGGCGGCGGCGGGGCGGGGCGGGGATPAIKDSATVRILGLSTLTVVMQAQKGTANEQQNTFSPSAYTAVHRPKFGSAKPVPYMQEGVISQEQWRQLQLQIQKDIEPRLVQLANQSEPPQGCDTCCNGECDAGAKMKIKTFVAMSALIKAVRDVHLATVNVQLDALPCPPTSSGAARKVTLCFGGGNSAYYLDTVNAGAPGYSALQKLQEAQAAEVACRAALVQLGAMPSSSAAVAPEAMPQALPGQQLCVQVPDGLSGGQTLHVQTPAGMMAVQIPPGLSAGQSFQIQCPLPAQTVTAAPVALQMQQG